MAVATEAIALGQKIPISVTCKAATSFTGAWSLARGEFLEMCDASIGQLRNVPDAMRHRYIIHSEFQGAVQQSEEGGGHYTTTYSYLFWVMNPADEDA